MIWAVTLVEGWLGPRFAHFAKPLLALVALIALAGLLWAAIAYHDSNVITAHDATANAKVIAKTAPGQRPCRRPARHRRHHH